MPASATNEERIATLEAGQTAVAGDIHRIDEKLGKMDEKIDKVNEKLAGRPTWAVTTIIAILFGACTCMAGLLSAAYG